MTGKIRKQLLFLWNEKPLTLLLLIAILLRLVSVVFSKGYDMHDDHYLIIEAPQSWVDGKDYNNWLPWNQDNPEPTGHSFFYIGFHFLFFYLLKFIGITDPQVKMFLVRFIHALFSLLIVTLGYRITEKFSGKKHARLAGLLLAAYWFMPFFSVRNLVEIVCIPFLMMGFWMIFNADKKKNPLWWIFLSGFVAGMAFSVRYQTSVFLAGMALALLLKKQVKPAFAFGFGVVASVFLFQGVIDFFIWGYPFAEFIAYSEYNIGHQHDFITGGWFNYLGVIGGMLIPPFSLLLFFGFLRTWKKQLLIFLPVMIFLVLHSLYPNKQERFIFPILPFIIMLGVAGWYDFFEKSKFWQQNLLFHRIIVILFWFLNLAALLLYTPSYAKKARVETMSFLSAYKNISFILIDDSNRRNTTMLPRFYLNQWPAFYEYSKPADGDTACIISTSTDDQFIKLNSPACLGEIEPEMLPDFVVFVDSVNLNQRISVIKEFLPGLSFLTVIEPGFRDRLLYTVNKVNYNVPIYIYETGHHK
ncbi:MAG: glycosyltransferase family 39 protein [Bacteroidales bacterium]|nr:glycosyltransferase family 39 protein [Bacteroidales bacterium]